MTMYFPLWLQIVFAVVISIFGIWACGKTADDLGVHDHQL
jgi:phosphatidylglycerophosphatase A